MEIWKDIPGYEGYYQASNLGNIKSMKFQCNFTGKKYNREKILKPKTNKWNSRTVELWKDGEHKTWYVHRLIGLTFLETPKCKMTINHKDGNRLNNCVDNLEWMTLEDNIKHGYQNDLYPQKHILMINKHTGEVKEYRSLSSASRECGKNTGYLTTAIRRGRKENSEYKWILLGGK